MTCRDTVIAEHDVPVLVRRVQAGPRGDPSRVHERFVQWWVDLMVPPRQTVELVVRQEVVLQERRRELWVWETIGYGYQRH